MTQLRQRVSPSGPLFGSNGDGTIVRQKWMSLNGNQAIDSATLVPITSEYLEVNVNRGNSYCLESSAAFVWGSNTVSPTFAIEYSNNAGVSWSPLSSTRAEEMTTDNRSTRINLRSPMVNGADILPVNITSGPVRFRVATMAGSGNTYTWHGGVTSDPDDIGNTQIISTEYT